MKYLLIILLLVNIISCQRADNRHLMNEVGPNLEGQWVNMVVEIPAGSLEKWEVNKVTGRIEQDRIDGQPRTIDYLGYPGNYGFIPQTVLLKEAGGDGDPLDVLVIGEGVDRGTVLRCKLLGVLKLFDNGEQDDKLIAVSEGSNLSKVNTLAELDAQYPGILSIIETWFTNYKGSEVMESYGYAEVEEAVNVLKISLEAF